MFLIICAIGLTASPGGEMLESVDEQFREAIIDILPEDYSQVGTDFLVEEAAVVADSIYSPHAPLLVQEAVGRLSDMPRYGDGLLQGKTLRDSMSLEAAYVISFLAEDGAEELDGFFYILRFWDPVEAASFSKALFLGRLLPPFELGGRTIAEKVVRDRCFLVHDDPQYPTIAVVSLEDVFIMEMKLSQSGFYLPLRILWYE